MQTSKLRLLSWLLLPAVAAVSFVAMSVLTPPVIPAVNLSADPLYATATGDKPVLALALSVEFPTVGAQYVETPQATTDASYTNLNEYLGYYDAESCYTYNNAPTETPVAPLTASDYKRFDRAGAAISRMCNTAFPNAFSGNFLNWASSSAIDMLRLSLTGGDRYIDTAPVVDISGNITTPSLTILQRAVLPNGDPNCFWNSANFPGKQLLKTGGASGAGYFGAVPAAMATAAGTNDIWIGNTLNRIFFGTSKTGGCGNTGGYVLGAATVQNQIGPVTNFAGALPGGSTECARENDTCSGFAGTQEIWYGANSSWAIAPATGSVECKNSVFGDPLVNVGKKCFYRNYTGAWTPTVSAAALNSEGFFYSRVQVCNVNASGILLDTRDYGFCRKYPVGNYKPSGAIQKYSDQLRLAAFGYLMDQTASYSTTPSVGRYGGVLRAPIKYVGGKTFDINGIDNTPTGGNPNKEWNESNGVLIVNPEADATYGKSGVITYLNQFGRTGPVPGRYKRYDPMGELHYETLRYLQGLQPSPDAISGITADMYDGFPVTTSWTDPYGGGRLASSDYSCLKSNIVMVGDVNTHDGNRLPTYSATGNIPDINLWRSVVQGFEKNLGTTYVDGQGVNRSAGNPNGANNSVPSNTQTSQIMGSAYWARTHDIRGTDWTGSTAIDSNGASKLRPGLRVKTFTFDVNEYAAQNNDNTRRKANQLFMASKYGGFETDQASAALSTKPLAFNTQGNPFKRNDGTDDRYVWEDNDPRTSRNGEANTYFLQSDARGVLSAFDDIFSRASTAARSIAGGAIQSKNLTQAGNTVFQGTFDTSDWSGDLLAIPVTVDTSNVVSIGSSESWTAASLLTNRNLTVDARNIVVGNAGATANPVAAPFLWATPAGVAGIEADLRTALDKPSPAAVADGLAQDRLEYLRGDRSKETNPFRKRNKLLGDIVNSGVAYSGAPTTAINDSGYQAFFSTNAARTKAVFVGANDGMLHAFNASVGGTDSGKELFAYIPSWLGPKLSALTVPSYVNNHQAYLDGTPTVSEALVDVSGTPTWKTVLVAGTGAGGQGVFALDVTNPSAFDASKVMWEFTHADDPDMGNVTGRPQILKLRTSAYNAASPTYKWFAVVGGGVNSYVGSSPYGSGYPALFLLDLGKPAGTAWTLGTNYFKISFPVNGDLSNLTSGVLTASKATGIINFKAALGASREVTQIYAGDLHGQLWKLDFSLFASSAWDIKNLSPFQTGTAPNTVPYPLFIAKDASGVAQPITMSPSIAFGPTPDSRYIFFGTGKYLEASDKTNTATQSAYMVFDNGTATGDTITGARASAISGRTRLKPGTVNTSTGVVSVAAFTLGRAATVDHATETVRSGWYFDFPSSGERQISNATVLGSKAVFGTLIPGATAAAGSCSAAPGGGKVYEVIIAGGNGSSASSRVGIQGEPLAVELADATTYTATDSTGRRTKTTVHQIIQQGSLGLSSGGSGSSVTTTSIVGRLSWRQINNYQDLKAAP
jgi:type IV pilus assembly protein PilY1